MASERPKDEAGRKIELSVGAFQSLAVLAGLAVQFGMLVSWGTRVTHRLEELERDQARQEQRLAGIEAQLHRNSALLTGIDQRLSAMQRD